MERLSAGRSNTVADSCPSYFTETHRLCCIWSFSEHKWFQPKCKARTEWMKVILPCSVWRHCHLSAAERSDRRPLHQHTSRDVHPPSVTDLYLALPHCCWMTLTPAVINQQMNDSVIQIVNQSISTQLYSHNDYFTKSIITTFNDRSQAKTVPHRGFKYPSSHSLSTMACIFYTSAYELNSHRPASPTHQPTSWTVFCRNWKMLTYRTVNSAGR